MIQVMSYPPVEVDKVWGIAEPFLQKAMVYAQETFDLEDMHQNLLQGGAMLSIVSINDKPVAAVCSEIWDYPKKKALRVLLAGGDNLDDWSEVFVEELNRYAKFFGVDLIEVEGRPGWEKKLKKFWGDQKVTVKVTTETGHGGKW